MDARRQVVELRRLGRTRYPDAHALQERLVAARLADEIPDTLLVTEHERVVTLGRGAPVGAAGATELPVFEVARGGEATWHGPGQIVLYPIRFLPEGRRDLHAYLRELEQVAIDALARLGVRGERVAGKTGVWVSGLKLCSIGVAVRRWVSWHGLALNVDNDLADFRAFAPCGLDPALMTRLADHVGRPLGPGEVERELCAAFERVFDCRLVERDARGDARLERT